MHGLLSFPLYAASPAHQPKDEAPPPTPRYSAITYVECATTVDCMGEHLRRTKRGARPGFCGRPQQLSYQSQTCHTLASPCSVAPSPYSFPSHQL